MSRATIKAFAPGVSGKEATEITKVFGKTGMLKWLDMRTKEGKLLKVAYQKFKTIFKDEGKKRAYEYIESNYGKKTADNIRTIKNIID